MYELFHPVNKDSQVFYLNQRLSLPAHQVITHHGGILTKELCHIIVLNHNTVKCPVSSASINLNNYIRKCFVFFANSSWLVPVKNDYNK